MARAPYLFASQEIQVRGFWDRYTKESQEKRKNYKRFAHIPDELNTGPTAYDQMMEVYNSMTDYEKRHAVLRVVYGFNQETGKELTEDDIEELGLESFLPRQKKYVVETIRNMLVTAGVVDTPSSWRYSRKRKRREKAFHGPPRPIGLEWWVDPSQ